MLFLFTYIDVRIVKFFPPAESWLVNSNSRRTSRKQGKQNIFYQGKKKTLLNRPISIIVNREDWLWGSPNVIKCQYLRWKAPDHAHFLVLSSYTVNELRSQHVPIG